MMFSPTTSKSTATRRLSGLTPKGDAAVALIAVRDTWDLLSPSQQADVADLVERLAGALRREQATYRTMTRSNPAGRTVSWFVVRCPGCGTAFSTKAPVHLIEGLAERTFCSLACQPANR